MSITRELIRRCYDQRPLHQSQMLPLQLTDAEAVELLAEMKKAEQPFEGRLMPSDPITHSIWLEALDTPELAWDAINTYQILFRGRRLERIA